MRLVKSLFIAIMAVIMTAIAGSTFTHLFEEAEDAKNNAGIFSSLLNNKVHAQESEQALENNESDTQLEANHTFTTSLNIHTPSSVIDETDLPTPSTNTSQSPSQEGQAEDDATYINILAGLVPISGEDISYMKILDLSDEEIKQKVEKLHLNIWEIAAAQGEVQLLENTYYAIYPTRIIAMFNQGIIDKVMADALIKASKSDIKNHINISIEEMIQNMQNQEMN